MSIFASPKEATFARAAFAAAGIDFNAAFAANDTDSIKKALVAKSAGSPDLATAEATLAAAAKENTDLKVAHATALAAETTKATTATAALATANASIAKLTATNAAALKFAGLTGDTTPEALTEALGLKAAEEGAAIVAAAGHPGFDETPGAAGSGKKKQAKADAGLTGLAATQAALKARANAAKN